MHIESGASSHVGRVRQVNEDAYLTLTSLAVVADGMGGHSCGDLASRLTIQEFERLINEDPLHPEHIHRALHDANRRILDTVDEDLGRAGMGTTVTGVALVDYAGSAHWLVFNVGDSRVYRAANHFVSQITVDHSEVAELIAAGTITPAQARVHPLRNVVTRSLGTDPAPTADVWVFPTGPDDCFVLCSDGLTNELEDSEIASILDRASTARDAAASLVGAAVDAGGRDNVTAVVVRCVPAPGLADDTAVSTAPRSVAPKDR